MDAALRCGAWASQYGAFSGCRVQALGKWAPELWLTASRGTDVVAAVLRLRCSQACGIPLDQGLNPHPLHWQVDCNQWTTGEDHGQTLASAHTEKSAKFINLRCLVFL